LDEEEEMKLRSSVAWVLLLAALPFAGVGQGMAADEITPSEAELCLLDFQRVPRMQIDELKSRLGDAALVVIDVRTPADWEASSLKIKGAAREVYADSENWVPKYDQGKTIVLYCA
jgi:hypothetical protein